MSGADYEFRVTGRLTEQARLAVGEFGELRIMETPPETVLYCASADEARLHGVLALLDSLGLHIVSVAKAPVRKRADRLSRKDE